MTPYIVILLTLTLILKISCRHEIPSNVSPRVWSQANAGQRPSVMVEMIETPETTSIFETTIQEIRNVVATSDTRTSRSSVGSQRILQLLHTLKSTTREMMRFLIESLEELGHPFTVLWSVRLLHIPDITIPVLLEIAGKSIVKWIRLEKVIPAPKPPIGTTPLPSHPPPMGNTTWNLNMINARCEELLCFGRGVLVGSMDTGVLWNHVELIDNWVGPPYGWWDGYANVVSAYPLDHGGHGTHTTATAVGKNVGVAPDAKWMACRMGDGFFPESAILKCGEFMCAPWEWDDETESDTMNPSVRPDVINNSWGSNGGGQVMDPSTDDSSYKIMELWTALGIIHVFSAGNNGPGCSSAGRPGSYDIALAVAALDNTTTPASFSARGPAVMATDFHENSTAKGSCIISSGVEKCLGKTIQKKQIVQLIKPDISAPGVNIRAAWNTGPGDYNTISGTSMAAPHVTGTIALMIGANRGPHWNQMLAYEILTETADTSVLDLKGEGYSSKSPRSYPYLKSSHILCNVMSAGICDWFPNNIYGYGLTNACDAAILSLTKTKVTYKNQPCKTLINGHYQFEQFKSGISTRKC